MTPEALLAASGIECELFPSRNRGRIFMSPARQLFGSHAELTKARAHSPHYLGWEAHHVFEKTDLERLDAVAKFPAYEGQLCVLIPSAAHRQRINQVLRSSNPTGMTASPKDLRLAYETAYSILGNYCGGGESNIRRELLAIVDATLKHIAAR
jgi:hypothetical protein